MHRDEIDAALAARPVAEQFPQRAALPVVPVEAEGWDNRSFRLGPDLSIRLPSAVGYAPSVEKELTWLPRLAPHLPLPIPVPVGAGDETREAIVSVASRIDPACDLVIAWTLFDEAARETFRAAMAVDPAMWSRARGWALWKALITLAGADPNSPVAVREQRIISDVVDEGK